MIEIQRVWNEPDYFICDLSGKSFSRYPEFGTEVFLRSPSGEWTSYTVSGDTSHLIRSVNQPSVGVMTNLEDVYQASIELENIHNMNVCIEEDWDSFYS